MNDASTSIPDHTTDSNEAGPSSDNATTAIAGSVHSDIFDENKRMQKDRKTYCLDNVIRNIDIMIYCLLSVLYYMDCSLFKFIIRALPHWFYFTPKPDVFPPAPLLQRPYIGTIFGTNIFCIILHLVTSPPAAGETVHGYLHGGLLIDFVGQHSPASKLRLLGLDLLTLALQILMLAVTIENQRVQGRALNVSVGTTAMPENEAAQQDHDAEEQGFLRSNLHAIDDIELQDLRPRLEERNWGGEDRGVDALFESTNGIPPNSVHPLDAFHTGEHVIANLHIFDTIRMRWESKGVGVDAASTASGVQTAATMAGRRLTFSFRGRARAAT